MGINAVLAICIAELAGIYAYREHRHAKQNAEIIRWCSSNAKTCTAIRKELEELKKEFNEGVALDAETAEKMWKEGVDNIMNYSLRQAMGALNDGRD